MFWYHISKNKPPHEYFTKTPQIINSLSRRSVSVLSCFPLNNPPSFLCTRCACLSRIQGDSENFVFQFPCKISAKFLMEYKLQSTFIGCPLFDDQEHQLGAKEEGVVKFWKFYKKNHNFSTSCTTISFSLNGLYPNFFTALLHNLLLTMSHDFLLYYPKCYIILNHNNPYFHLFDLRFTLS